MSAFAAAPAGVRLRIRGRGKSFRDAVPGRVSAGASPAPRSHVGSRDPCSSVLGRASPVCERPPTSGRLSQGRREDPSLLPPAAAQPSGPCECALPASRQDSEGRPSLGRTPHPGLVRAPSAGLHAARAPSALRPDPRSAPFNLP